MFFSHISVSLSLTLALIPLPDPSFPPSFPPLSLSKVNFKKKEGECVL